MSVATRTLTLAIEAYDRHLPFHLGTVKPLPGVELRVLDVGMIPAGRDGGNRHARMLRDGEFDIAEVSFSSYVLAKAKGAPFTATPVFPRRLFSQNHIFVNRRADIAAPRDLAGKRVAIRTSQVTISVLAKGDLKSLYDTPWEQIRWVAQDREIVPWVPPPGVQVEQMPAGRRSEEMLLAGDVDAMIDPRPSEHILMHAPNVKPLFDDPRAAVQRYFAERRCYPIMHVVAIKDDVARAFPELAREFIDRWEAAKAQVRELNVDFAWGLAPLGRWSYQDDVVRFGADPYPSGLAANRANLEWFLQYHVDQALVAPGLTVADLFHPSTLDT